MKPTFVSIAIVLFMIVAPANADLIAGNATHATSTTATGTLNGVAWNATTSAMSPFIGINGGSGHWDLHSSFLATDGLFLGTSNVNAGDWQRFNFASPIQNVFFYIENFDSSSAATIHTDANLSFVAASPSVSLTSSPTNQLVSSNTSHDGEGDVVLFLGGPTSYIQFDYTAGEGANGIYYGFAQINPLTVTAVPEPSSFLLLMICGGLLAYKQGTKLFAEDATETPAEEQLRFPTNA